MSSPSSATANNDSISKKNNGNFNNKDFENKKKFGLIFLFIGMVLFIYSLRQFYTPDNKIKGADTLNVATMCLVGLTIFVLSLSWLILLYESKKSKETITLKKFFDLANIKGKNVIMGMIQGFVFGTIDNFGMSLGIDGLENLLKKKTNDIAIVAGISNLYSSVFGSVMGSCLEKALKQKTKIDNTPWWGNLLGIIFGSLFGIFLSKILLPKKK